MAYSLKKRKQLSKLSKKNKTKLRKAKKTKRTRRFRKQYGGDLSTTQEEYIEYIEKQIEDLEFTDTEKKKVIGYFNDISSHMSKTISLGNKSSTVIVEFFKNVNSKYQQDSNLTDEDKQEILLYELFVIWDKYKDDT
jgi:hypothetical protein